MKIKYRLIATLIALILPSHSLVLADNEVNWSYDSGVLTVWGNADMTDYLNNSQRPWEKHLKDVKKLVIKEGITSVGDWSFAKFEALEELELPSSLVSIGERAFYNCSNISYINLPDGLKTIENGAFNSCKGAVRVRLPETLETIGDSAFMNLPNVPVITIPESVENIGMWAFMGCTSLEQLYFEGDVPENIGEYCLADIYSDFMLYYSIEHRNDWLEFDKIKKENLMAYYPEDRIPVYLNNSEICFDIDPIIVNGRTLVPMRAVFEALGAVVTWDGEHETATATRGGTSVSVQIGADIMRKNNQIISLDAPAMLYLNRTLVPVRAVSEAFDAFVDWSNEERAVYIEIK